MFVLCQSFCGLKCQHKSIPRFLLIFRTNVCFLCVFLTKSKIHFHNSLPPHKDKHCFGLCMYLQTIGCPSWSPPHRYSSMTCVVCQSSKLTQAGTVLAFTELPYPAQNSLSSVHHRAIHSIPSQHSWFAVNFALVFK